MTKFSLLIIIKFINERVSKRSVYRNLSRETTNLYFFALYNQQIVYFCNMKAEDIEKTRRAKMAKREPIAIAGRFALKHLGRRN